MQNLVKRKIKNPLYSLPDKVSFNLVFSFYLQTSNRRVAHHFFCLCPRSAYNSHPSVPPGVLEQRNWGPSVYTYSQWWNNQQCLFVCWLSGLLSPSLATAMNSWAPIFKHLPASQILLFYVRHFPPPTKYTQNPELFLFFFHIDFLPRYMMVMSKWPHKIPLHQSTSPCSKQDSSLCIFSPLNRARISGP